MLIQSTHQIGEVIHHAVVFDAKNWPGDLMNSDEKTKTILMEIQTRIKRFKSQSGN